MRTRRCAADGGRRGRNSAAEYRRFGRSAEANTARGDAIPNVQLSSALMYQLMAAEVAVQRGELGSAFAVYMKLARETRDPRLARRAAELALQARAMAQGLEAAQVWHELAPNSTEASQTLAMLYTGAGRFDDAYTLFKAQLQAAANPGEELARIQRALARTQDRAGAFNLIERLAQPYSQSADVKLVLANAAQAAGLSARAVQEARAAYAIAPDSARRIDGGTVSAGERSAGSARAVTRLCGAPSDGGRYPACLRATVDRGWQVRCGTFGISIPAAGRSENPDLVYSMALLSMQGKLPADARTYLQRYLELIAQMDDERAGTRPVSPLICISRRSRRTTNSFRLRSSGCARSMAVRSS